MPNTTIRRQARMPEDYPMPTAMRAQGYGSTMPPPEPSALERAYRVGGGDQSIPPPDSFGGRMGAGLLGGLQAMGAIPSFGAVQGLQTARDLEAAKLGLVGAQRDRITGLLPFEQDELAGQAYSNFGQGDKYLSEMRANDVITDRYGQGLPHPDVQYSTDADLSGEIYGADQQRGASEFGATQRLAGTLDANRRRENTGIYSADQRLAGTKYGADVEDSWRRYGIDNPRPTAAGAGAGISREQEMAKILQGELKGKRDLLISIMNSDPSPTSSAAAQSIQNDIAILEQQQRALMGRLNTNPRDPWPEGGAWGMDKIPPPTPTAAPAPAPTAAAMKPVGPTRTAEDEQAIMWATDPANANDPRAARIRRINGIE